MNLEALNKLDPLAKQYSAARTLVSERVADLNDEVRALYRRRMPGIRDALAAAKSAQDALSASVEAHKPEFQEPNPRTTILHGIKLGLKKGAGKISWEIDDDVLVARIEKMFADNPDALELLIQEEKKVIKGALKALEVGQLAKLGITVEGVCDYVVISEAAGDAKKLTSRILKEGAIHEADPDAPEKPAKGARKGAAAAAAMVALVFALWGFAPRVEAQAAAEPVYSAPAGQLRLSATYMHSWGELFFAQGYRDAFFYCLGRASAYEDQVAEATRRDAP